MQNKQEINVQKYIYDSEGYNAWGFNKDGYDNRGFDRDGDHRNGTKYDPKGSTIAKIGTKPVSIDFMTTCPFKQLTLNSNNHAKRTKKSHRKKRVH
jgi:hypothetical protein